MNLEPVSKDDRPMNPLPPTLKVIHDFGHIINCIESPCRDKSPHAQDLYSYTQPVPSHDERLDLLQKEDSPCGQSFSPLEDPTANAEKTVPRSLREIQLATKLDIEEVTGTWRKNNIDNWPMVTIPLSQKAVASDISLTQTNLDTNLHTSGLLKTAHSLTVLRMLSMKIRRVDVSFLAARKPSKYSSRWPP